MKKAFYLISLLLLLFTSAFAILHFMTPKPPVNLLEKCYRDISAASETEAKQYAAHLLRQADSLYNAAREMLIAENQKPSFRRNYDSVITLSSEATKLAQNAVDQSTDARANLESKLEKKLKQVQNKIDHFQETYAHLPLDKKVRKDFTTAILSLTEAQKAFDRGAFLDVGSNLDQANTLISKSVTASHKHLGNYFLALPDWKEWVRETIDWTAKNRASAVVVDKFAHKCYVYKNGKLMKEFVAEMGPNWIGDKQYRGDKATPEGKYHITEKKSGKQTIYYKAFLINYPNQDDKQRYNSSVKNGSIPNRGIGNLIEIHGGGGKGINWTDGCVALTNEDMDQIWNYVKVGTPVTIVGSIRSLEEINGQ
jgi:lipoprotein-anchoring transpeptidase ErfK/SrfK